MVGFAVVLQHTPRPVIAEPPVEIASPPLLAVDEVISVTAEVVAEHSVVKLTSVP